MVFNLTTEVVSKEHCLLLKVTQKVRTSKEIPFIGTIFCVKITAHKQFDYLS